MANFLLNSPSSEAVGTNTSDLFDLDVLQGVSVYGLDGADNLTATADEVASAARLNGGKGADTVTLSGGSLEKSEIFAGMGKDIIDADGEDFTSTIVRGGAGLDTLTFSAAIVEKSTINGNDMADTISAQFAIGTQSSFVGLGAGKDTLTAVFVSGGAALDIRGGLGHDVLNLSQVASGRISAFDVRGGGGKDTITFATSIGAELTAAFFIDGGDQADQITFSTAALDFVGTATIQGGAGADTINFSAAFDGVSAQIGGGLGNDSIHFGAEFTAGSVNGGAGTDTITMVTFGVTGNQDVPIAKIFGDSGADKFNLGTVTYALSGAIHTGGSSLGYASFDQSNLSAFDFASASITQVADSGIATNKGQANLFTLNQSVVTATIANGVGNPASFTGTDGVGTFTSTFATDLTARVAELDRILVSGQTISFTADGTTASQNFVFVQGGAAGSGSDNDLLIRTNVQVDAFEVMNNTAIRAIVSAG